MPVTLRIKIRVSVSVGRSLRAESGEFVFNFKLFALEGGDYKIVPLVILHLCLNLPVQLLVAPLERRDVAFSSHKQLLRHRGQADSHKTFTRCRPWLGPLSEI